MNKRRRRRTLFPCANGEENGEMTAELKLNSPGKAARQGKAGRDTQRGNANLGQSDKQRADASAETSGDRVAARSAGGARSFTRDGAS